MKRKWRKIICFNTDGAQARVMWCNYFEALRYIREMRGRGECTNAYIVKGV